MAAKVHLKFNQCARSYHVQGWCALVGEMCLQSAVIFFAFKNITLLKIFGKFDVTNVCSLFFANSVLYASLIHSFIGYLRISFLGWGLLSARLQGQIHQGQPAVASVEKRDRGCFSNTRKHRGQNWLISSARTSNVTERVSCDLVSFNVVWNFLHIILSCTKAFKMAVKRVLQVLRRVTEFKEYVLVTFKEEGERLLSC